MLVLLLHLLFFYWLSFFRAGSDPTALMPPINVTFFPMGGGGGAPAEEAPDARRTAAGAPAASNLHVPPDAQPWWDPPPAPLEPASAADAVIPGQPENHPAPGAAAPAESPSGAQTASGGRSGGVGGGTGTGRGPGVGSGSSPGRGDSSGLVLIRGPVGATITRDVSPVSLAALPGQYAVLRCYVMLNGEVSSCRVLRESPTGGGVGRAAVAKAEDFRFRPPNRVGRTSRYPVTLAIAFPAPDVADTPSGVDGN